MNIIAFNDDTPEGPLHITDFLLTPDDIMNTSLVLIYAVLVIIFPVWGYIVIMRNFDHLGDENIKEKYGVFYEDNRTGSIHQALYNIYFMARRFITVLMLCTLLDFPFFQCSILTVFSITELAYLMGSRPLLSNKENKIEQFNEMCILFSSYLMTTFLNVAMEEEMRYWLGTVLIGIAGFNITINLIIVIANST